LNHSKPSSADRAFHIHVVSAFGDLAKSAKAGHYEVRNGESGV